MTAVEVPRVSPVMDRPRWCAFASACLVAALMCSHAAAQLIPPSVPVKLTASDARPGDNFGWSVAYSHGRIAVGTPHKDHAGGVDAGAVYSFTFNGSNWVQEPMLYTTSVSAGAEFGRALAMSEDLLVVGAWHDARVAGPAAGSVWVFTRGSNSWGSPIRLDTGDHGAGDEFGASVAVCGDWIAAGAPSHPDGRAYLFQRNLGSWRLKRRLQSFASTGPGDRFGWSVAFTGDSVGASLAVGAPGRRIGSAPDAGAVFLFSRSTDGWFPHRFLLLPSVVAGAKFGRAVSAANRSLLVATEVQTAFFTQQSDGSWGLRSVASAATTDASVLPRVDVAISTRVAARGKRFNFGQKGEVLTFNRTSPHTISAGSVRRASDGAALDYFGSSVALDAGSLVVGAPFDDHAGGVDAGSVYVFRDPCTPNTWSLVDAGGPASPPGRLYPELARRGSRVVLFGGQREGPTSYFGDTWEWNGSRWIDRSQPGGPLPRRSHALVSERQTGRVILFGGLDATQRFGDMWQWDGSSWTPITNSGDVPTNPAGHKAVYDTARNRIVMYRNPFEPGYSLDTFEWRRTSNATGVWTRFPTATSGPGQRLFHAMVYDEARRVTLLHGGSGGPSPGVHGDTWTWDGATWTQVSTSGTGLLRSHFMGYDPVTETVVMAAGSNELGQWIPLTWTWNGSQWTSVPASTTDVNSRLISAVAWDSVSRKLLLFGGRMYSTAGTPHLGDTRVWCGPAD